MDLWNSSNCTHSHLEGLIHRGLLCVRTDAHEWRVPPAEHYFLVPPDGYVVSFAPFHERGFTVPPHCFLLSLLHEYKIELQHCYKTF
jgi:hypothetical protein